MKNKIKDLRSQLDLTQEDLAKKLGVSRQTIISIETGRYNPSLILAYKMALIFCCKIEDIFDFSEAKEGMDHE